MKRAIPPIVRLCENLLVDIEQAVMRFHKGHRYTFGGDLRDVAYNLMLSANNTWRQRDAVASERLVDAIESLKIRLQVGCRLKAFRSREQFEMLARDAAEIGRQAGGWHRSLKNRPQGQSPANADSSPECAKTLSARAAFPGKAKP